MSCSCCRPTLQQLQPYGEQVSQVNQAIDILHDYVEATCGLFMDSLRGWEQLSMMFELLVDSQVKKAMTRERALMSPLIHGVDHRSGDVRGNLSAEAPRAQNQALARHGRSRARRCQLSVAGAVSGIGREIRAVYRG